MVEQNRAGVFKNHKQPIHSALKTLDDRKGSGLVDRCQLEYYNSQISVPFDKKRSLNTALSKQDPTENASPELAISPTPKILGEIKPIQSVSRSQVQGSMLARAGKSSIAKKSSVHDGLEIVGQQQQFIKSKHHASRNSKLSGKLSRNDESMRSKKIAVVIGSKPSDSKLSKMMEAASTGRERGRQGGQRKEKVKINGLGDTQGASLSNYRSRT